MERLEDMYYNSYTEEQIEQGIAKLYYDIQQYKQKALKPKKVMKQTFKYLPVEKQIFIRNLMFDGHKVYEISKKYNIKVSCLIRLSKEANTTSSTLIIGYKTDPYATEQEMIDGFIIPTYESLSESEKEIYNLI